MGLVPENHWKPHCNSLLYHHCFFFQNWKHWRGILCFWTNPSLDLKNMNSFVESLCPGLQRGTWQTTALGLDGVPSTIPANKKFAKGMHGDVLHLDPSSKTKQRQIPTYSCNVYRYKLMSRKKYSCICVL